MDIGITRIAMGDAGRYIGHIVRVPTALRETADFELSSADCVDGRMIIGLGREDKRITATTGVRLWTPRTRMAHARCALRCDKHRDHDSQKVLAWELEAHIGSFAFMETDSSPGPHRILAVRRDGPAVVVTISSDEAIGNIDYRLTLTGARAVEAAAIVGDLVPEDITGIQVGSYPQYSVICC